MVVSINNLFDTISSLPLLCPADAAQLQLHELPSKRRPRRKRKPDGFCCKHLFRRQLAIKNLPIQIDALINKFAPLMHLLEVL